MVFRQSKKTFLYNSSRDLSIRPRYWRHDLNTPRTSRRIVAAACSRLENQIAYGQKTIAKDELKLQCRRIRDQSDSFKDLCQTFPRAGFLSKSKQFRVEIIFSNKSKLESLFS